MSRHAFPSSEARRPVATLFALGMLALGCSDPISPVDNWPFVVVAGTVTRANGDPVATANVRVDLRMPGCADGLFTFGSKTTDVDGRYAVNLVGAGPSEGCVRVRVSTAGAESVYAEESDVNLLPGRPPADTIWISVVVP